MLSLLLLDSGCQYASARLRDAADCIAGSVTVGPGFMVDAQATWLAWAGGGYLKGRRYAFYYGSPSSGPTESTILALSPLLSGNEINFSNESFPWLTFLGMPCVGGEGGILNPLLSFPHQFVESEDAVLTRRKMSGGVLDIGFDIHIGYIGIELRLKPAEIIDFILGLVTIDIPGDDIRTYGPPPEKQEPVEERPVGQQPFSVPR